MADWYPPEWDDDPPVLGVAGPSLEELVGELGWDSEPDDEPGLVDTPAELDETGFEPVDAPPEFAVDDIVALGETPDLGIEPLVPPTTPEQLPPVMDVPETRADLGLEPQVLVPPEEVVPVAPAEPGPEYALGAPGYYDETGEWHGAATTGQPVPRTAEQEALERFEREQGREAIRKRMTAGADKHRQLMQEHIQRQQAEIQRKVDRLWNDITTDAEALSKQKVDTERWWSNRSTGQRIAGYIAAALQGWLHPDKPNAVIRMINQQVEQDINAQIAELQSGRADLTLRRGIMGDLMDRGHSQYSAAQTIIAANYNQALTEIEAAAQEYDPEGATAQRAREIVGTVRQAQAEQEGKVRDKAHKEAHEDAELLLERQKADYPYYKLAAEQREKERKAAGTGTGTPPLGAVVPGRILAKGGGYGGWSVYKLDDQGNRTEQPYMQFEKGDKTRQQALSEEMIAARQLLNATATLEAIGTGANIVPDKIKGIANQMQSLMTLEGMKRIRGPATDKDAALIAKLSGPPAQALSWLRSDERKAVLGVFNRTIRDGVNARAGSMGYAVDIHARPFYREPEEAPRVTSDQRRKRLAGASSAQEMIAQSDLMVKHAKGPRARLETIDADIAATEANLSKKTRAKRENVMNKVKDMLYVEGKSREQVLRYLGRYGPAEGGGTRISIGGNLEAIDPEIQRLIDAWRPLAEK
jgi:hypothetical protein